MEVTTVVCLDVERRSVVVHLVVVHGPEQRDHEQNGHEGGKSPVSGVLGARHWGEVWRFSREVSNLGVLILCRPFTFRTTQNQP